MTQPQVKVIEDSVSVATGKRLTTLQLCYPRFIHAEFMTHRVFSRNASSSRAIPVAKMIEQVRSDPAMPVHWGKNQPGMQAHEELDEDDKFLVQNLWRIAAQSAASFANEMAARGAHKQVVNRILEPFQWIHVVVTATEWDNFFDLRAHPDAQPEIHQLAVAMRDAMRASTPATRKVGRLDAFNWHLPYVLDEEREQYRDDPQFLARLSAARCARVSYLKHDGSKPSVEDDLQLFIRLVGSAPLHASPTEHQAYPLVSASLQSRNFFGYRQFRELVESGLDPLPTNV